jgi:hypothetical protein
MPQTSRRELTFFEVGIAWGTDEVEDRDDLPGQLCYTLFPCTINAAGSRVADTCSVERLSRGKRDKI